MPPRYLILAFVVFWLVMVGLFVAYDVWPWLAPSEPLLFPVDLVDEAGPQRDETGWVVLKNAGGGYRANIDWEYQPRDDTFRWHCQLTRNFRLPEPPGERRAAWLPPFRAVHADSSYWLTRSGEMVRLEAKTGYGLAPAGDAEGEVEVSAEVRGAPRGGGFVPHVKLSFPGLRGGDRIGPLSLRDFERDAAPVPVFGRGLVLNPLQPPRRLPDLRPGQRWRVTVIDPFAVLGLLAPLGHGEALRGAGIDADADAYVLDARVLPDVQAVFWDDSNGNSPGKAEDVPCRVVQCTGDGPVARLTIWAREEDGFLLKQEAEVWGDVWTFWRRAHTFRMHTYPPTPLELGSANLVAQALAAGGAAPALPPLGAAAQVASAAHLTNSVTFTVPGK
jgi:hypothetical protein